MARLRNQVAFITGAARGQGRSTALRLAEEGADIIAIDIAAQIDGVPYRMAGPEDLARTVKEVEDLGRRIVATQADVRDFDAVKAAVDDGVARLGRLDIAVANAGIIEYGALSDMDERGWRDVIDVNLTGAWHTIKAAVPHLRESGGGAITITSSAAGLKATPHLGAYVTSKHGLVGLMRTLAIELGPDRIRVNSVHPTSVDTEMIQNQATYDLFFPHLGGAATREDMIPILRQTHLLPVPWVEPQDVANAVAFLSSDEARYITGVTLPVDAGFGTR